MPYYRIVIWTSIRIKPFSGIKLIGDPNINTVYKSMRFKAIDIYKKDLVDFEVQMLSKLSKAVIDFERMDATKKSKE